MATSQDSRPVTILILGILGLVMCQPIGAIAWFLGHQYEADCLATGETPDQMATIGKILGMVAVGLFAFFVVIFVLMAVLQFVLYFLMVLFYLVIGVLMLVAGAAGSV